MKQAFFLALAFGVCAISNAALAQNCRTNFGGSYTAPHFGMKPNGHFFSAIAFFDFDPNGTFHVSATINERDVGSFPFSGSSKWWWVGPCDIAIDRAAFVGHVSDDGRFVSLATNDAEQLSGIAIRDSVSSDTK
jgi:hypothetical protein